MKLEDIDNVFGESADKTLGVNDFLSDVRANWTSAESSMTRTAFLILTLAVIFILLREKWLKTVPLEGVSITKPTFVEVALPTVTAYLTYALSQTAAVTFWLGLVHDYTAKHYWPDFAKAHLQLALRPYNSFAASEMIEKGYPNSIVGKPAILTGGLRFFVFLLAPMGFTIYALWVLSHSKGLPYTPYAVGLAAFLCSCQSPTILR